MLIVPLIAMIIVVWFVYQRVSSDQPREVVAPFALSYAWILAPRGCSPGIPASLGRADPVSRNRMTRWLTLVTVFLALCHSSGGQATPGIR